MWPVSSWDSNPGSLPIVPKHGILLCSIFSAFYTPRWMWISVYLSRGRHGRWVSGYMGRWGVYVVPWCLPANVCRREYQRISPCFYRGFLNMMVILEKLTEVIKSSSIASNFYNPNYRILCFWVIDVGLPCSSFPSLLTCDQCGLWPVSTHSKCLKFASQVLMVVAFYIDI